MNKTSKKIMIWGGRLLAITGIVFVAIRLHSYSIKMDFNRFNMTTWLVVAGLILIYGIASVLFALAWWNLLAQFKVKTSRRWAVHVYGVSQIAKYIPGNIFHLAGRQGMGMADGIPGWSLAKASIWELGLISVTGALFGILATPLLWESISVIVAIFIFMIIIFSFTVVLWRLMGMPVVRAFLCQSVFLIISGALFVVLVEMLSESGIEIPWVSLCGAYILAWWAGLITPGAPAGVGVRELVLLFFLNGIVGNADLIIAIILGRIVTVSGDVIFYLIALLIKNDKECNLIITKKNII